MSLTRIVTICKSRHHSEFPLMGHFTETTKFSYPDEVWIKTAIICSQHPPPPKKNIYIKLNRLFKHSLVSWKWSTQYVNTWRIYCNRNYPSCCVRGDWQLHKVPFFGMERGFPQLSSSIWAMNWSFNFCFVAHTDSVPKAHALPILTTE